MRGRVRTYLPHEYNQYARDWSRVRRLQYGRLVANDEPGNATAAAISRVQNTGNEHSADSCG